MGVSHHRRDCVDTCMLCFIKTSVRGFLPWEDNSCR